jgi:type III pantothenate kinase
MLLTLDVGNSAVKGGLFERGECIDIFSVALDTIEASAQSPEAAWREAFAAHLPDASIEQVGLASVVPATAHAVTEALADLTGAPVVRVGPSLPLPFELAYETPDTLGVDRLAAAAAGWVQFGRSASPPRSVIVVDAGTAVTCEVVHRDGVYEGGTIAAGPVLARQALQSGTAQLPAVPLALPDDPVGHSTQTALQSGIMWSLVDSVRGMTARLAGTLPDDPQVVLTGGWGALLANHLDRHTHHAPHLVLHGIRLLVTEAGS